MQKCVLHSPAKEGKFLCAHLKIEHMYLQDDLVSSEVVWKPIMEQYVILISMIWKLETSGTLKMYFMLNISVYILCIEVQLFYI